MKKKEATKWGKDGPALTIDSSLTCLSLKNTNARERDRLVGKDSLRVTLGVQLLGIRQLFLASYTPEK